MKIEKEQKLEKENEIKNTVKENYDVEEIKETINEIDIPVNLDIVGQYSNDLPKLQGFCRKLGISQKGICSDLYERIIHFIKTGEEKPYKTLEELRKICRDYELIHTGNKDVLEERIKYYLETGNKVRYVNTEEQKEIAVDEEPDVVADVSFEKDYIMKNIDKGITSQVNVFDKIPPNSSLNYPTAVDLNTILIKLSSMNNMFSPLPINGPKTGNVFILNINDKELTTSSTDPEINLVPQILPPSQVVGAISNGPEKSIIKGTVDKIIVETLPPTPTPTPTTSKLKLILLII